MPDQVNIIGVYDNTDFSAPIEYTFDLIFSAYGISYKIMPSNQFRPEQYDTDSVLVISYGTGHREDGVRKHIHIYSSDFLGKNYLKPPSMPQMPLKRYEGLPIIYPGSGQLNDWVKRSGNLIETNIDIIASSFFMLSRYEEIVLNVKDEHDRFPATASLAYQEGFLDRPIVNEYIELLWSWVHSLMPELERKPLWPENKNFAFCLTHDVDRLNKYNFRRASLSVIRYMLGKAEGQLFKQAAGYLLTRKDPWRTFDRIVAMEKAYGFHSSFFFLARKEDPTVRRYDINKKDILKIIKKLAERGWEVGLHGSYIAYDNSENLVEEYNKLAAIVAPVCGVRMHYLRFNIKDTVKILEQLGIAYDCSMGYPYNTGFRSGIALPYHLYNFNTGKKSSVIEIPLIFQEPALRQFLLSGTDKAVERIADLFEMVRKYHGCVSVLWHNDYFDSVTHPGYLQLYADTIKYIHENNGVGVSCKEIADLIKRRTTI